jgi:uncharacterized protein (TIGR03067 family)
VRRCGLFAAVVLALGFAPAPFPKPDTAKDDLQKIQGTWNRISCTQGTLPPVPRPLNDTVVITGDRIAYPGASSWVLTLGNVKGTKTWDIKRAEGSGAWTGVYELQGNTLRVCFTPSATRPKSIQPTKTGEYLQTFQRPPSDKQKDKTKK